VSNPSGRTPLDGLDPSDRLEPIAVPLQRIAGILRRHILVILALIFAGTGGMAAYVFNTAPLYTAESSVLMEPRRTQVSDLQAISADPGSANLMRTQVDIFRSPALARRVVEQLGLLEVPAFQPRPGLLSGAIARLRRLLGLAPQHVDEPTPEERLDAAALTLLNMVGLRNEARSNVLYIWAETRSPTLSANIANALAQEFLDFKRHQKFATIQRAHQWLNERLGELAERVRQSEQAIEQYRQQHGLAEVMGARGATNAPTVNRQQLDELTRQLVTVSAERARKEAQLAQARAALRSRNGPDALPEVLNSPIVQRLREQMALAAAREAELATSLGDSAPVLRAARSQLRGLQQRLQAEMDHATSGLVNEVASARAQEQALRERLETLRGLVVAENAAEVRLQGLMAEAQATRAIYESFLSRATQLANVAGIQDPDAELVSPATPFGTPSFPRKGRLLVVAFVLSLALGVALACLLERMRHGFSTPEALEAGLGVMLLGVLPNAGARARLRGALGGRKGLELTAALSRVRGILQVLHQSVRPRVILITSALPEEGKTVFAAGFARNAAEAGARVLLMDCDLRRPAIARQFDIPPMPGLAQILEGGTLPGEAPVLRRIGNLDVMPGGIAAQDPQELLGSRRFSHLLSLFREKYDIIVIDAPPVLPMSDALILARHSDTTMLAVRWEKTPQSAVRDALRLLRNVGADVLGAVLTRVDLRRFAWQSSAGLAQVYRAYRSYYRHGKFPT